MKEIYKVYIPINYSHGEYMLKDIEFNTERQNEDDIFIEVDCDSLLTDIYWNFRFWDIGGEIKDISEILRVSYGENNILKSVEVLRDNNFYPYIYNELSDDEMEEKIRQCIKICSDNVIGEINKKYENDIISRIFIYGYMESGNEGISLIVGNKAEFDNASLQESVYGIPNVDYTSHYYKPENEIYIKDNEILHSLTNYLDNIDYELCNNFHKRFIDELKNNILNGLDSSISFADDFKFIFHEVD